MILRYEEKAEDNATVFPATNNDAQPTATDLIVTSDNGIKEQDNEPRNELWGGTNYYVMANRRRKCAPSQIF